MDTEFVLLVEDNPGDAELTVLAFKKTGIANEVIVTEDGQEALDFLFGEGDYAGRDTSNMPIVVLLDLKLPEVDGLEVLERIRADERTKRVPVVVLTSSLEEQDIVSSYDLGANSYVRKPVDFGEFADAARQLGFYWLLINRPPPMRRRSE